MQTCVGRRINPETGGILRTVIRKTGIIRTVCNGQVRLDVVITRRSAVKSETYRNEPYDKFPMKINKQANK